MYCIVYLLYYVNKHQEKIYTLRTSSNVLVLKINLISQ